MKLTINGKSKEIDPPKADPTLAYLVELLGHNPLLIVVEFNGTILPPKNWTTQIIKDGDSLEIVTIVGGGS